MAARVTHLWRHPIKAHGAESVDRTLLTAVRTMPWDRVWAIGHEAAKPDSDADGWGLYEDRRQEMLTDCKERLVAGVKSEGTPPDAVALAIEQALFEPEPRTRYLVVPEQVEAGWTIAQAVEEMLAFNVGHEYTYSRDEIVELIDALWPFASGEKSWHDSDDEAEMMKIMDAWMERRAPEADDSLTPG